MKVLLYLGGGLGNVIHASTAIEGIRRAGHDLTVWVGGEWGGLAKFIDHDKVVTGEPPDAQDFDRVFRTPYAFTGADAEWGPKYGPDAEPSIVPLSGPYSEAEACFWFARVCGYDGLMPPPSVRHATETPVEDDYIVIAPGVQTASVVWLKKRYKHWREVANALSQVNKVDFKSANPADNSGPGSEEQPGPGSRDFAEKEDA